MRKQVVAGNWKMNNSLAEGEKLTSEVISLVASDSEVTVILATPFLHLVATVGQTENIENVFVAAQNCSEHSSGAFTGEVSVSMLNSSGVEYVIIGHSERRAYFNESSSQLRAKVDLALAEGLTPIFCCGEPLEIREDGSYFDFVANQLTESLFHLTQEQISKLVIAYEPIWAIGTGKTASSAQAQEMHKHIRNHLASQYGNEIASEISILYGGSCKPDNARELFANEDVDGGLIGGASLDAKNFAEIVKSF